MIHCWVPIFMEIIGNNLYKLKDNMSLALEIDELDLIGQLKWSAPALAAMDLPEVMEECCMDVWLELSLGLSSGEVECRKWVRETNENVIVKKPKMEEGPMPYCLQVMPIIVIGPKGYCYAYMMPCWVPISMKPRDYPSFTLEMNEVTAKYGVEVRLEHSLGLSFGKVECKKWVKETNETAVEKKPKIEEGPMFYCVQVMPMIFIGSKGYYYAYIMP
ncbi:hypothetical protein IEQ34_000521 [Dendrobium chrysotoxum]|uniref:Uncharacterized protein n=1 Tax=Dendrobium chrysotoxum TaxID=161865 RepID=A0AAV7HT60_DENCH|nr:hypothetical protein IEQ34_000521 [Dendrobium chrysotoxum]